MFFFHFLTGADPNICDNNGDTPLIKAIWSTMSSSVEREQVRKTVNLLVECGANINALNESGRYIKTIFYINTIFCM
jgi:hypothetical protein